MTPMSDLVLGPLVRYVDTTRACVWVETGASAEVTVVAGERRFSARTFAVHGHHYALLEIDGLGKGTHTPYAVEVDGTTAWPPADTSYPEPVLATLEPDKPLRLAFGSCRTSVGHDAHGNRTHGVDAMRAYALRMAGVTHAGEDDPDGSPDAMAWPDLVLFLGDQVYADETTQEMQEFIESRRSVDEEPGTELKDYEEYAHLYKLAWSDPANRWLLSTLPSLMIFDDHDIRDDWNTSQAWKEEMEQTSWWHGRIVAGLASYWVYQHLGNMTPEERAEDPVWRLVRDHDGPGEADVSDALDAFADRADQEPESYRWSYVRELGTQARLVVVDSRAARVLDPEKRSLLDEGEFAWLDEQLRGDVDHLLIGTSLPYLLAPGLHYVEAFNEALARGAWGRRLETPGEKIRQTVDLEHWAAFQDAFQRVARTVLEVSAGRRGRAPRTITFLSGDVHHSYVSEAFARGRARRTAQGSRILQAVCSPIRNPLARKWRFATAFLSYGVAGPLGHVVARSAKVPDAPDEVAAAQGALVRQQPRDPGGRARRAAHLVGDRRGARRRPRAPAADHRRRRAPGRRRESARATGAPAPRGGPHRAGEGVPGQGVAPGEMTAGGCGWLRWGAAGSPRYADEPALPTTSTSWEAPVHRGSHAWLSEMSRSSLHTVGNPPLPRPTCAPGHTVAPGSTTTRSPTRIRPGATTSATSPRLVSFASPIRASRPRSSGSPICGIVTITQRSIGRRIRSSTSPIRTVRPSQSSSSKPASVPLSTSTLARARGRRPGCRSSSAIRASDDVVSRCRSASSKCGTSSSRARRTARPTCRLSRSWTAGSSPRTLVPSGNATTGVGPSYDAERESRPSIFRNRRVLLPLPSLPSASRTAQRRSPSTPRSVDVRRR